MTFSLGGRKAGEVKERFSREMDRYFEIKKKILEYAGQDDAVKAVVAIGSTTRKEAKADEFSDLDLFIVTEEPEPWYSGEYPQRFGDVRISFLEPTLGGGKERRSIYDADKDVDMLIFTPEEFVRIVKEGIAGWVMNRGYEVLYDSLDCTELLGEMIVPGHSDPSITEEEFLNILGQFYFHDIWAAKKIRRGELWSAKMCVDSYLKTLLLRMLEVYRFQTAGVDTWHDGRFLERWAGEEIVGELQSCFGHYEREDLLQALISTHKLFARITREIAEAKGFSYPEDSRKCAEEYLEKFRLRKRTKTGFPQS